MIKINELRIGNIILLSWKNAVNPSTRKVDLGAFMDLASNGSGSAYNYEPIPLTEEWLSKFGFDKIGKNFRKFYEYNPNLKEFVLYYNNSTGFYEIKANNLMCTILSVHQLQNLYFALTGKELELSDAVS